MVDHKEMFLGVDKARKRYSSFLTPSTNGSYASVRQTTSSSTMKGDDVNLEQGDEMIKMMQQFAPSMNSYRTHIHDAKSVNEI